MKKSFLILLFLLCNSCEVSPILSVVVQGKRLREISQQMMGI